MAEDKPKPKLDARGRASVFHFQDGWIKRQPIDCRQIVESRQGAAQPSREQFAAWWAKLAPVEREKAIVWESDAGDPPLWLAAAVEPPAPPAPPAPPPPEKPPAKTV